MDRASKRGALDASDRSDSWNDGCEWFTDFKRQPHVVTGNRGEPIR
jgi:hypothetical protein